MAQLIIHIPDGIVTRAVQGLARRGGWTPESLESAATVAKSVLLQMVLDTIVQEESSVAFRATQDDLLQDQAKAKQALSGITIE